MGHEERQLISPRPRWCLARPGAVTRSAKNAPVSAERAVEAVQTRLDARKRPGQRGAEAGQTLGIHLVQCPGDFPQESSAIGAGQCGCFASIDPALVIIRRVVRGPLKMFAVTSNWRALALGGSAVVIFVVAAGFTGCTVIQPPPDFTHPPSAADVTSIRLQTHLAEIVATDARAGHGIGRASL